MKIPSIAEIDIKEKKIFIRADLDVPVDKSGVAGEVWKIERILPTVRYALQQKAKVILAAHRGKPGGKVVRRYSLEAVGAELSQALGCEIYFPEDSVGDAVKKVSVDMPAGSVMLLENLDFHKKELEDNIDYAKRLAEIADIYVNEAFTVSNQKRASLSAITGFFNTVCVGLSFKNEIENLGKLAKPDRPFTAVIGGRCTPLRLALMEKLMDSVDSFLLGGAVGNLFLKTLGKETGRSEIDQSMIYNAKKLISSSATRGIRFIVPVDLVTVRGDLKNDSPSYIISDNNIPTGSTTVDIGPETRAQFANNISGARTVFWNGPLGICEEPGFFEGSRAVAEAIAESDAWGAVTGRDTAQIVHDIAAEGRVGYVSRSGEAAVEYIINGTLPAITALEERIK
ncbi:MAG: phosphoglycerate kinase [Candidatus Dadabacteria bacterium]|nr:phosphoglycerate kinase [Candidatus Dadabacteria bacterium]